MQSESWPELSEWELNSWALLTVPDIGTSMGNQSLSSQTQTQTFSQPTNFYDTSLVSSNFNHNDINDILNAPSNTSTSRHSPQQQFTSTSSATSSAKPPQSRQSKTSPSYKSPASSSSPSSPNSKVHKRTLNTLAARRYRQKRVDQMADLEQKLKESEKEKEELQMRVARLEGEVEVLRGLLRPSPK
jgi:hypothetical protein